MAAAGGEGVEKLEDMIVRAAEATAGHVAAAKAAIGNVIFGQEKVVEQTLITILSGGHGMLVGVPGHGSTPPDRHRSRAWRTGFGRDRRHGCL